MIADFDTVKVYRIQKATVCKSHIVVVKREYNVSDGLIILMLFR